MNDAFFATNILFL